MTNALNSLKLELEQSDDKNRAVNIIHAQTDSIINSETLQKSIPPCDVQHNKREMLVSDKATEESTRMLTNIINAGDEEQENASREIEKSTSNQIDREKSDETVQNLSETEMIAVEVNTDTVSGDFVSKTDENRNDVSAKISNQDKISKNPVIESESENILQEIKCQYEKETTNISKSADPEKHADPEIHLDEITEKLAHLKLEEKSPVLKNRSPSPHREEINVPHMEKPTHFMMEHQLENIKEKLMASKSTNTVELTANHDDSLTQEMETLKVENEKFRKSNENIRQELKILEGQKNDEKERYETARRKLKKKVFEYEKKIEELLKARDENHKTKEEALNDLRSKIDQLISEKRDGEHQFKELEILFEAQKQTISEIQMSNNDLIERNKDLENDKQLIESDNEKLKKITADEKELNKNAKRKLKNKISEYERKIGRDNQCIGNISDFHVTHGKNYIIKSSKRIFYRRKTH